MNRFTIGQRVKVKQKPRRGTIIDVNTERVHVSWDDGRKSWMNYASVILCVGYQPPPQPAVRPNGWLLDTVSFE